MNNLKRQSHTLLKGIHKGKDIYVLGSGNSISYIDRDFFQNKITIGVNSIYKKFDLTYAILKHHLFIQAALDKGLTVIISKYNSGIIAEQISDFDADYIFSHKQSRAIDEDSNFRHNIDSLGKDDDIFVGFSTIVSGIHLAAYMGAKTILLVGHDCGYLDKSGYFDGWPEHLVKWHGGEETCVKYYNEWYRSIENQTLVLKKKIKEVYGCNIYSINPFINFGLEGHKYDTKK